MDTGFWLLVAYITLNFLVMTTMIFVERRKLASVISWLTVVSLLPGFGFFLYMIFGSGLSIRVRVLISKHKLYEIEYDSQIRDSLLSLDKIQNKFSEDFETIKLCHTFGSVLCPNNDVKFLLSGEEKMKALLQDIHNAKETINIEYYIFEDDHVGKMLMKELIQKAKSGVKVKLIYDSIGSLRAPRRFFNKLKKVGGEVGEFFPPLFGIRLINLKVNYRNHRKIVVIDGKIAYTGGINIRDDHMGKKKRLSPWRDTHIRVTGTAVYMLQNIFLSDWRCIKKDKSPSSKYVEEGLFPEPIKNGKDYAQVLSSGPDVKTKYIRDLYLKLIAGAKKEIFIQTPYFIPDEILLNALKVALYSGVKVRIMVPKKIDHLTVHLASLSYLKEIEAYGAEIFVYQGFLHGKVLLIDSNKLSVGTCNFDNRSFNLNFENTVLFYSENLATEYRKIYENDQLSCVVGDSTYFAKKKWLNGFLQALFRLFSPIM